MKVLVVEDEKDLLDSIVNFLNSQGFIAETAITAFEAEDKLLLYGYDLVLLDITLPDGNGLDLLNDLKERHPLTGILIISAKNALDDKVKGLDLGADDYLVKPFHLTELNARINAVLRRRHYEGAEKLVYNEIEVTPKNRQVTVNDSDLGLTQKEFELLLYFMTNKNRVVTKSAIAEHLWGEEIDYWDNWDFLYAHVKNLRRKIQQLDGSDYIHTIYGLGYKFGEQ